MSAPTRHPPSDGAHRLAWWLAGDVDGDGARVDALANVGLSAALVARMLSGEVEPDDSVAGAIAHQTDGAVRHDDWLRDGPLGWQDAPRARDGETRHG